MSQGTTDSKKQAALEAALNKIRKDFGDEALADMENPRQVEAIPTGSLPLDIALGVGGIPKGRIIEIFGPESSGKTTLCYHLMHSVQQAGGEAAFIDVEHAMDAAYAQNLGVNIKDLIVSQPDYGEQALEIAEVLTQSGAVDLIVVDSVAALVPQAELAGAMEDSSVGLMARLMSKACRKLAPQANKTGTTIVFTNQIREKIGVSFGSPETQPGGRALKFYASQRLDIRRIETLKDGTEAVGNRVSDELFRGGMIALGISFLAMLIYIWVRFEWQFAIGAILTLILDVTKAVGFFALTGLDFNLTAVAALLTGDIEKADEQALAGKGEALRADVLLAPHPFAFDMAGKLERWKKDPSSNPFVDSGACRAYAATARKRLETRLASESKP